MYAYTENFVLPISHDEVVHGKGSMLEQDPRRPVAADGDAARAVRLHVGAPGQAVAVHGPGVRQGDEWAEIALARLVAARRTRSPRRRRAWSTDLNRVYSETAALWSQDSDPAGFHWIDANDAVRQRLLVRAVRHGRLDAGLRRQLLVRPARALPDRPAGRRPLGARSSTPTPTCTSAPRSATSAASTRCPSRGTASRRRRRCGCRRSARSGCVTTADRPDRAPAASSVRCTVAGNALADPG